jgi:hypothetical protein
VISNGVDMTDLFLSDAFKTPKGEEKGRVLVVVGNGAVNPDQCVINDAILKPLMGTFRINPQVQGGPAGITDVIVNGIKGRQSLHFSIHQTANAALSYISSEEFCAHKQAEAVFKASCMNSQTISDYGPGVWESLNQKGQGNAVAVLKPGTATFGLDFKLHYTHAIMFHGSVPVFTLFNTWSIVWSAILPSSLDQDVQRLIFEYAGMADIDNWIHTYPPGTMFYCENRKQATSYSTKKHGFHYYENLLEIDEADRPTPTLALVPGETIENPFPAAVQHLWENDEIPRSSKKATLVRTWGLMGKQNTIRWLR